MRTSVWGGIALAACIAVAEPAHSIVYGGGGGPSVDCLAVFEGNVNEPPGRPRKMRCTDGDAACDEDGLVNGICAFDVSVCANSTFDPGRCSLAGVDEIVVSHALDNGDPKFDPDFQALQSRIDNEIETPTADPDVCTTAATIRVPIRGPFGNGGCKKGDKLIKLTTESQILQGKSYRDSDKLTLICDPPPNCDPGVLFTGTFDRVQRQIFNPSCGVSSCHDSESTAANLILEEGTAYGQTVDLTPTNGTAAGLGWKRIDGANASPETSLLFHKVTGDLGPGLGNRMPLNRGKLPRYLIDLLELWILAGAPENGWVPGTD